MNEYKRLQKLYPITFTTLLITAATMVLCLYLVIFAVIVMNKMNQCTINSCFGIDLKSLIPDYSGLLSSEVDKVIDNNEAIIQSLKQELNLIKADLKEIIMSINQFKILLGR